MVVGSAALRRSLRKMRHSKSLVLLAIVAAVISRGDCVSLVTSTTTVSNLDVYSSTSDTITRPPLYSIRPPLRAMQFTTGSAPSLIDFITLSLNRHDSRGDVYTGSTIFLIGLHADADGLPGDRIATLASEPPDPQGGVVRFVNTELVLLASSQSYWIVTEDLHEIRYSWNSSVDSSDSSDVGWTIRDGSAAVVGDTWMPAIGNYLFSVDAQVIPEPSTTTLLLGSAVVLTTRRRRKNKANKAALLTPAPPRVHFSMVIQPSTHSRTLAPGQV